MSEKNQGNFSVGDTIFFRHPKHSWVVGVVTGGEKNSWACKASDEVRECVGDVVEKLKESEVTSCREDLLDEEPHDLLTLTVLHDSTLLRCLYIRYFKDIIYTNIGAIVVALNPYNYKIPWYMDDKMEEYLGEGSVIEKNIPHSWAQAHNTYNEMIADRHNQCVLISGESGAGKTEATKIVMKYLARISCLRGTEAEKAAGMLVGAKLNSCSPILEAFGNARTVRNDNSSRFGKFMKVKFADTGILIGAHTTKYLLEKSRIVTAAKNERVYHSFYMMARGKYKSVIGLEDDRDYKNLTSGDTLHNSEYDTVEDFDKVCGSMSSIGMKSEEIDSIWTCSAGIMSILNVTFSSQGEGSVIDASTKKYLMMAIKCWKVDEQVLQQELVTTTLTVMEEATKKLLRPALAVDVRDALAKALYNGEFGWLVTKSNELCDVAQSAGNWIGLLDIFGFEDFQKNSFEQLCINLTNETLQNHYNGYIFTKDMEECKKEGIDVTEIKCPDNQPCLDLIMGKKGIIALLDEECTLGKGTDISMLEKVDQQYGNGKHPFFERKKTARDTFLIRHYAAEVTYEVQFWLEKNRDTLKDSMRILMRNSSDSLIKTLLEAPMSPDEKRGKQFTVGGTFKDSLHALMEVINSTNPHWIRCVKPHPAKQARMFDGIQTMNQLESSGVLGTVKIRKAGYPIRTLFEKFNVRYRIIIGDKAKNARTSRDVSDQILVSMGMKDKKYAQMGKTKVFMKSEAFPIIERKRNEFLLKHAKKLEMIGRGYIQRVVACRDRCTHVQRKFATLLLDEYRQYLKRSKEIREYRAKLRKEAEEKYRSFRLDLEVQGAAAHAKCFDDFLVDWKLFKKDLDRLIEIERKRIEATRAEREAFLRNEYLARMQIFDEAMGSLKYDEELYAQEISLFIERELEFVEEWAMAQREKIMEEEKKVRNQFLRSIKQIQTRSALDRLVNIDSVALRPFIEELESLQRSELAERFSFIKKQQILRSHFVRQMKVDEVDAKNREKQHKAFDRWKDKQLFRLEQLRRDELYRLQVSQASSERAQQNTIWDRVANEELTYAPSVGALHETQTSPVYLPTASMLVARDTSPYFAISSATGAAAQQQQYSSPPPSKAYEGTGQQNALRATSMSSGYTADTSVSRFSPSPQGSAQRRRW